MMPKDWLRASGIAREGDQAAAPFAVVDAEGDHLLRLAVAGLNLDRYIRSDPSAFMAAVAIWNSSEKPHVIAERVIVLDDEVR